ncbi:hypothetical protein, partial [Neisseria meningitidis]|uniref:hypothetical protein n=1 Tax=Neisseria meningitidis TaxID=487 RepID=UPI001E62C129
DGSVATVTVRFRLCWNFGKLMNRHSRAGGNLNFNASRIYRKKPKPFRRHSHESGNLEMKSSRNLSEMTETERTGFPLVRE